jgi:hypothetical protein
VRPDSLPIIEIENFKSRSAKAGPALLRFLVRFALAVMHSPSTGSLNDLQSPASVRTFEIASDRPSAEDHPPRHRKADPRRRNDPDHRGREPVAMEKVDVLGQVKTE